MELRTFKEIKNIFEQYGLQVVTDEIEYKNTQTKLVITNGKYRALESFKTFSNKFAEPRWFSKNNPFIIDNVNKYLSDDKEGKFICLSNSDEYMNRNSLLEFKCIRCGNIFKMSWANAIRDWTDVFRRGISCKFCDNKKESIHARVLKQIFIHEYPDTIPEEKSCRNPLTGCILPTDIVNHRLKIAVEVQSVLHNRPYQKEKDLIKKNYWINKGYKFYDEFVEDYSLVDYIKIFFPDIDEIPKYVKYSFDSWNIHDAQILLDMHMSPVEIAEYFGISEHRIYDAIYSGKLNYAKDYISSDKTPVVQFNLNKEYMGCYDSMAEAEKQNNIPKGLIASCIYYKNYYCKGYYWIKKEDYDVNNYELPTRRTDKFYQPVECFDLNDKFIGFYNNMYEASKATGIIPYKIWEVATGVRKTRKGYKFKLCA